MTKTASLSLLLTVFLSIYFVQDKREADGNGVEYLPSNTHGDKRIVVIVAVFGVTVGEG